MARFHYIVFGVFTLILFSCGQVGSITGGEKDTTAPRVLVEKVIPPIGSTNIYPQKITIPFDEFIEFNKPAENILVTPSDVKLDYAIKQKTVLLTVKSGTWSPNTTYTIYLNRAVKDITEANDSIIAYVFSTGDYLDSLKTAVQVNDAYSGKPVAGSTVGLYTGQLISDTSDVEPRYYASTNEEGVAYFQYIKDTTFFIYAFDDENLNNRLDETEKRAILNSPVLLDTVFETVPIIRLMVPEMNQVKVISNEVIPTATWVLSFNRPLKSEEDFTFLPIQPLHVLWNKERDSLNAFYGITSSSGSVSGVLNAVTKNDTIIKKFFFKNKDALQFKMTTNLSQKVLFANDTLKWKSNEPFVLFDTTLVTLNAVKEKDTLRTPLAFQIMDISPIEKYVIFDKKNIHKVFMTIPPDAVKGLNYSLNDSLKLDFTVQKEKETGVMIIEFDTIPAYGILVITNQSNDFERKVVFDGVEKLSHRLEFMQAGKYSFYYIYDQNKDGKWTTGSIFEGKEAEKIDWFTTKSTIRANWEVKTTLPIKVVKEKVKGDSDSDEE